MEEIWKDIVGYDGLYQVSNFGMVRSLKFNKVKILKTPSNKYGYNVVHLLNNNKNKSYYVHRIVAQEFIPNSKNYPMVNHKDENKSNNRVDNLEWCDNKYNLNYGTAQQRKIKKQINRKDQSKPVLQYTKSGEFVKEYPSAAEAHRQTGVYMVNICTCCRGNSKYKSAGGYVWKYKEV